MLGSAVVVVALIVGSVAGLTRILGDGPDTIRTGNYDVFQRTATVEAFTVTSPSDWYLVNEWPLSMLIAVEGSGGSASACFTVPGDEVQECEDTPNDVTSSPIPVPQGLPMLQLSNVDLGLGDERVRRRAPRRRRRSLRGARLRRCDRGHRGSVDPGVPARHRAPARR